MEKVCQEAFYAVEMINELIDNSFYNDKEITYDWHFESICYYKLEFFSNGNDHCIEFLGHQLWNSEDDEREYDDDKDDYAESIVEFIFKEMTTVLNNLTLVKKYVKELTNDKSK
jgi:hypothetical protein